MKKKVFFQRSMFLFIGLLVLFVIVAAGIYVIVSFFIKGINKAEMIDWIYLIFAVGGAAFCSYTIIRMVRNRIVLLNSEIFVPGNWGSRDYRIQYEVHIKYNEIKNIFIIINDKNSLNQESRWVFTPMPNLVFECMDGSQKVINVFYYTKKQVVKIIDVVIERAKMLGNNLDIKSGSEILLEFVNKNHKKT